MSNSNSFSAQVQTYTGRIKIASTKAMPLALLLEKAAPRDLSAAERRKLEALVVAATAVESVHAERDGAGGVGLQPLRLALTVAFAAMDLMLEGASWLSPALTDKGTRAVKLRAVILPEGREFTKSAAYDTVMYARRVLARIDQKRLAPELKDLIGPEPLKAVHVATDDLAEALGLGESTRELPSATAITDAMTAFLIALCAYTRALSADVDETDEASCKRFLAAVAPIDQFRSFAVQSSDATDGAPQPATPAAPAQPSTPVTNGSPTAT